LGKWELLNQRQHLGNLTLATDLLNDSGESWVRCRDTLQRFAQSLDGCERTNELSFNILAESLGLTRRVTQFDSHLSQVVDDRIALKAGEYSSESRANRVGRFSSRRPNRSEQGNQLIQLVFGGRKLSRGSGERGTGTLDGGNGVFRFGSELLSNRVDGVEGTLVVLCSEFELST
jgi:hypothetical protein